MKAARLVVIALGLLLIGTQAWAAPRFRLVGIGVGVGYSHFSGPYWGPYWGPYGYPYRYGAGWWGYDPFWPPFYSPYYALTDVTMRRASKGEVQLKTAYRDGEVYINGAYAGEVRKLHNMWLDSGAYDLEVRAPNQPALQKRIYVLTGKTLTVRLGEAQR